MCSVYKDTQQHQPFIHYSLLPPLSSISKNFYYISTKSEGEKRGLRKVTFSYVMNKKFPVIGFHNIIIDFLWDSYCRSHISRMEVMMMSFKYQMTLGNWLEWGIPGQWRCWSWSNTKDVVFTMTHQAWTSWSTFLASLRYSIDLEYWTGTSQLHFPSYRNLRHATNQ